MSKSTAATRPGLVLASHGHHVEVEDQNQRYRCVVRRNLGQLVAGDRVRWRPTTAQNGVIESLRPRTMTLSRPDRQGRARPLAANITRMIVVLAPAAPMPGDHDLLNRYLVAAELLGLAPLLIANKVDQRDNAELAWLLPYGQRGYPVVMASALRGDGLAALMAALEAHTSIVVGRSGVGKSSLIKALQPAADVRIGNPRGDSHRGRHTTATVTLYHLPQGGDLIDSPGVRDFRLWPAPVEEIARGFIEFRPYLGECRFHNCRHRVEPGCAIQAAADRGEITAERLASYRRLIETMTA